MFICRAVLCRHMNMRQTGVVAGASLAAVAGLAAVLSSAGLLETDDAAKAGSSALSLYGVAHVVHTGADGTVLDTQSVHNRLLDAGEDFLLDQVFRNGVSEADSTQMGAICLSADAAIDFTADSSESFTATQFESGHIAGPYSDYTGGPPNIAASETRECLTDTNVTRSGQIATIGPLTFTANTTTSPDASRSNWAPGNTVQVIGICKADSAGASAAQCASTLFAGVDISPVQLNPDETLTVTYTFNMGSEED